MENKDSLKNTKSQENKMEKKKINAEMKTEKSSECSDIQCPFHGTLAARGRIFEGNIIKKFNKRIAIEFERTIFIKKYERYAKKKTKLHARVPMCMEKNAEVGDYVRIRECRPLSKIIHFVLIEILRKKSQTKLQGDKK